ncbi:MAG: hypothetical protein PPHEESC_2903 [uncultured Paraburkholderia sp.]|nr:MAG: hypothetical protein PPHEESC_2903 [uncultured Paraburkholderia sp.]
MTQSSALKPGHVSISAFSTAFLLLSCCVLLLFSAARYYLHCCEPVARTETPLSSPAVHLTRSTPRKNKMPASAELTQASC